MQFMITSIKNLFLMPALMAGLSLMLAGRVAAQTFSNLHSFGPMTNDPSDFYAEINSDGLHPEGSLILSGKTLYGTTSLGTPSGSGAVFAVNIDGSGFTNLHVFAVSVFNGFNSHNTNADGVEPSAGLILSGNTLYGTTSQGTSAGVGTVFAVNTDGTGFTNLYNFTGTNDGTHPVAALLLSGNTLYGTTSGGGAFGYGTVFAVNTNGTALRTSIISLGLTTAVIRWPR